MLSLLTHIQIPSSIFREDWQNYSWILESFSEGHSIQHQFLPFAFYKLDICLKRLVFTEDLLDRALANRAWSRCVLRWSLSCLLLVKVVLKLGQGVPCVEAWEFQSSDLLPAQPIGIAGRHTLILIEDISVLSPHCTHKESKDRGSSKFYRQWSYYRLPDDCHVTATVTGFPHAWLVSLSYREYPVGGVAKQPSTDRPIGLCHAFRPHTHGPNQKTHIFHKIN